MPDGRPSPLPIPLFQVLEEEELALRNPEALKDASWEKTLSAENSWVFQTDHLSDALLTLQSPHRESAFRDFANRLRNLLGQEPGAQNEAVVETTLVALLNQLVACTACLVRLPKFPREQLKGDLAQFGKLRLSDPERQLANRLLLEALFPVELRRIYDIRLSQVYARLHAAARDDKANPAKCRAALCLSGGGIRSATFALGIVQGLARRNLLREFDFLSTVSGGGYIGGWLSSWIHHSRDCSNVLNQLKCAHAAAPTAPEPRPLTHLRMFSNYLTPRLGAFSADTWTLIGIYLRNLFVNWLVFVPFLLALFALPRVYVACLGTEPTFWVFNAFFVVGALSGVLALAYATVNRPSVLSALPPNSFWATRRKQEDFLRWCLLPLCASAFCLSTCWLWLHQYGPTLSVPNILRFTFYPPAVEFFVPYGLLLHLGGWMIAQFWLRRLHLWEFVVVLLTGALGGLLTWTAAHFNYHTPTGDPLRLELDGTLAFPVFLSLFLISATIFIGLLSRRTSDEDREWWARMGAWILIVMLVWLIFFTLVILGPRMLGWMGRWLQAGLVAVGGAAGVVTLLLGHAAKTPRQASTSRRVDRSQILLFICAPLALAFIVVGLSELTLWFLNSRDDGSDVSPILDDNMAVLSWSQLKWGSRVIVAAAGGGFLLSLAININKFSIHAIYRDRLVRAYLGASNPKRCPNDFTGFDPKDNLLLSQLRNPGNPSLPQRPLHLINMALNLVAGENLAWQQRKAETFTASTLFCGNFRLGFRRTDSYARHEKKPGLTLGSAIAISGAAASPNQGYHSSPLIALLMTLFNVRLGWWLGNPGLAGHATFPLPAPRFPVRYMVKEGLGMTDSSTPYVYLSDGGHFENLGLYEMILRRCRWIVVSDAGCDPKCALEDLGNAIRKIRIDLGVKIEIKDFRIRSREDPLAETAGKYCALGTIDYSAVDGPGASQGIIVYFKPAICGDEPRDVFNYKEQHPEFPHESTGDQWFSESQFESYRQLGMHMIDQLPRRDPAAGQDPWSHFVACVREYLDRKA